LLKEKLKGQGIVGKDLKENKEVTALVAKLDALRTGGAAPAKAKAEEKTGESTAEDKKGDASEFKDGKYVWKEGKIKAGFERPVIIHRAILGSVERMVAILTEHYGGKWPFWMSPRQVMVIPVAGNFNEYAKYVTDTLCNFGFYAEMDDSSNTLNKKVRNAQVAQWNYQCIVGGKEEEEMSVNLRSREDANATLGDFTLSDLCKRLKAESEPSSVPFNTFTAYKGRMPEALAEAVQVIKAGKADGKADAKQAGAAGGASSKAGPAAAKGAGGDEAFLEDHPYLGGFAPSKKDATMFASTTSIPKTPNMARWFEHMASFSTSEKASWA